MDYTPKAEEIAENYRQKLIEYYKLNDLDKRTMEQIKEFNTESLLCMAARDAICEFEERIRRKKEEQKQH